MKSGLEGRNNPQLLQMGLLRRGLVSMKSGLEGRNNNAVLFTSEEVQTGLNEVRPRRPEQSRKPSAERCTQTRLNEVRPGRPEQSCGRGSHTRVGFSRLNEVRPGRPEQWVPSTRTGLTSTCLNEVRPGRPEQYKASVFVRGTPFVVSMKSGLEGRNNTST